jgi:hypothetical protein
MATQSSVLLHFQRPDGRAEFERSRRNLKATLFDDGCEAAALALAELAAMLDTGVGRIKRDLMASSLCWNDDHYALIAWVHLQQRCMSEMGFTVAAALRREGGDPGMLRRVAALTIFHWGEAQKWSLIHERPDYAALHDLLLLSSEKGRHRETFTFVAGGRGQATSIAGLYFRALLLDRFNSGSLTLPQVEILDGWLWEWSATLQGEAAPPAGPFLRVDIDSDAGLRCGMGEPGATSLYLPLAPLEAQRRIVIQQFHRGRIVPAHGCASDIRIEEHIAVLDHLRLAFSDPSKGAAQRPPRRQAGRERIEVWVGLQEILARAVGVGVETGRWRAVNLSDPAIERHAKARFADATRRYFWIADESLTGFGFEALATDADSVEVGDLIGWKGGEYNTLHIARVMRRLPAGNGQVFLGAQILTESAVPLNLQQVLSFDNGSADGTYLYVPGDDESGRRDAIIVPESTYDLEATFGANTGDETYRLFLNRVRAKGRGWVAAGFEIVTETAVPAARFETASNDLPMLELTPEDDEHLVDPWTNEVRNKLLW